MIKSRPKTIKAIKAFIKKLERIQKETDKWAKRSRIRVKGPICPYADCALKYRQRTRG